MKPSQQCCCPLERANIYTILVNDSPADHHIIFDKHILRVKSGVKQDEWRAIYSIIWQRKEDKLNNGKHGKVRCASYD
jgi:hypothetical protein